MVLTLSQLVGSDLRYGGAEEHARSRASSVGPRKRASPGGYWSQVNALSPCFSMYQGSYSGLLKRYILPI